MISHLSEEIPRRAPRQYFQGYSCWAEVSKMMIGRIPWANSPCDQNRFLGHVCLKVDVLLEAGSTIPFYRHGDAPVLQEWKTGAQVPTSKAANSANLVATESGTAKISSILLRAIAKPSSVS